VLDDRHPPPEPHPGGDFLWTRGDHEAYSVASTGKYHGPQSEREGEDRWHAGELNVPGEALLGALERGWFDEGGDPSEGRHYVLLTRTSQNTLSEGLRADNEPEPTELQMESIRRYLDEPWPLIRSALLCLGGGATIRCLDREHGVFSLRRFRCRSWRCPWCGPGEARKLFARLTEALGRSGDPLGPWWFLTLTFDPKTGEGIRTAYRRGGKATQSLRDAIRWDCAPGRQKAKIDHAAVWERHRSGWPHAHVLLRAPELDRRIQSGGIRGKYRNRVGELRPIFRWTDDFLRPAAIRAGFGKILHLERADNVEGMGAYFSKLSSEMAGTKAYQQPTNSPKGFRRVRTSQGLLPARLKPEGDWCGDIIYRPLAHVRKCYDEWGGRGLKFAPWEPPWIEE